MTDKAPDLLPCPFCGGKATHAYTLKGWKVECEGRMESCAINARTHYQPHKFLAVTAWNTRARADLLDEAVKVLEASRVLTTEAAGVGFNHNDGDWTERMFAHNGVITATLTKIRGTP